MSEIKLDNYNEIMRCNRCGFCQSACPTYKNSLDETQVARGRIHLARLLSEGRYDLLKDQALMAKVDDCLLCGACVEVCPSTVATDDIMRELREKFLERKGLPLFQRLVYRGMLSHRERLDRVSLLMRLYKKSGLRHALYRKGLRRALDRLLYFESFLPDKLAAPARASLSAVTPARGRQRLKVAFFVGCASNIFAPQTVGVLVDYLAGRGVEVHLPKVACCGQPHLAAGDRAEAHRLALKNWATLAGDFDFIVTDCSSCAHALSTYDELLGLELPDRAAWEKIKLRILEINTLIVEHLGLEADQLGALPKAVVTYHDSCHAVRGLKVRQAPREIIQAIPGLEFKEMAGADSCCGGAGSYSFSHPKMSGRIAAAKVENILAVRADILATSCPACMLQLGAALRRAGQFHVEVVHPVELLARAGLRPGAGLAG